MIRQVYMFCWPQLIGSLHPTLSSVSSSLTSADFMLPFTAVNFHSAVSPGLLSATPLHLFSKIFPRDALILVLVLHMRNVVNF